MYHEKKYNFTGNSVFVDFDFLIFRTTQREDGKEKSLHGLYYFIKLLSLVLWIEIWSYT